RDRSACRHPLRHAAACPLRRDSHVPRIICSVQYPRGSRWTCPGSHQGAGFFRMIDDGTLQRSEEHRPPEKAAAELPAETRAADASLIPTAEGSEPSAGNPELARMTDDVIAALKTVYDPEIPADIYEIGLIYK